MAIDIAIPLPSYLAAVGVGAGAAFFDLRTRRIPNWLVVSGLALGLFLAVWQGGWNGLVTSLAGFGVGVALMLPGYLLKHTGGGDLKLMAVLGSLMGTRMLLYTFVLFALMVGAWALAYCVQGWMRRGASLPFARYGQMLRFFLTTGQISYVRAGFDPDRKSVLALRLPVAPAIALASIAAPLLFD